MVTDQSRGMLRCLAAAATLLIVSVSFRSTPYFSVSDIVDGAGLSSRRRLSIALPGGGCQVTYAKTTTTPIQPTWQASFPGSGARMTYMLVEALTGIRSNDDYDSHKRGYENVVTAKTHYPVKKARGRFEGLDPLFPRAFVLLRNPKDAIPSYFNLLYERQHQLPNHSTRGPTKDWLEYRENPEHGVLAQLNAYENFVEYWMERYADRNDLLLISYEDLTDPNLGPTVATQITTFLAQTEGVEPIDLESVPCVWETIVNYKKHTHGVPLGKDGEPLLSENVGYNKFGGTRRKLRWAEVAGVMVPTGRTHPDISSQRKGPKVRPYSEEQLVKMKEMFQRLLMKYEMDNDLTKIMYSYINAISKTPIEEGLEEEQ